MKKALIIANMLFASVIVFGMNESLVNQENNRNVFVEVKELSQHEQDIREQIIRQIYKVGHDTHFKKINDSFEAVKNALSNLDVSELQNEKPLTNQQFESLMIDPRILNSVDRDGNTLLSYTIKSFYNMIFVGGGDGWNASWNRERLLLLSNYMLDHGANPFLKMSDKDGPLMDQVKDRCLNRYLDKNESEALERLLFTYEEATKNWKNI